jgi:hypothetical protein
MQYTHEFDLNIFCSVFLHNVANSDSDGALMGFRFPFTLIGTNVFQGNIGGGVSLLQTNLNSHGYTLFEDNIATSGGGMELRDSSVVCVVTLGAGSCIYWGADLEFYKKPPPPPPPPPTHPPTPFWADHATIVDLSLHRFICSMEPKWIFSGIQLEVEVPSLFAHPQ